jgi:hypothetical protein
LIIYRTSILILILLVVENVDAYDNMKKELYRRELNKQVEELRQLREHSGSNEERRKPHPTDAETNAQVPHYLRNPFMKQSAESWTSEENLVTE